MKVCIDSASNIKARKKSTEPSFSQVLKIEPIIFLKIQIETFDWDENGYRLNEDFFLNNCT